MVGMSGNHPSPSRRPFRILCGDIGGTSARFGWFEASQIGDLVLKRLDTNWLATREYACFEDLLAAVTHAAAPFEATDADAIVIAAAGPVDANGVCTPPNIAWSIDIRDIRSFSPDSKGLLVNDFEAQAAACLTSAGTTATPIFTGKPVSGDVMAVIGAGTGLGKAILLTGPGDVFRILPSEGGHENFPFLFPEDEAFQRFMHRETGRADIESERVVSGPGLARLHRFLTGRQDAPAEISRRMDAFPETLERMAVYYGRVCRNFALNVLPRAGLFITGGLAMKNPNILQHPAFAASFHGSSTLSPLLKRIPVFLITDPEAGLWGAARLGFRQLGQV